MSDLRQITLRGATGQYRTAVFESRDYVVVPVIALVEGVIHALNASEPEFVPADVFSLAPAGWNGRPVMHNHPVDDGKPVSANSPSVLESSSFGRVFNTKIVNKQLHMEGWIDIARATALGGDVQKTLDRILDGKPVEVSVGVFITAEKSVGVYNGKQYGFVWRDLVPDHLAFLEEGHVGACSNTMGCGVRAAAVHQVTAEGIEPMSEAVEKRSLRERLKGILPFRTSAKGYSDNDVRDALRNSLRSAEPLFAFIDSVFESDGYVIYMTANSADPAVPYAETYFKRSFTLDKSTGAISLGDDRTAVEPVVNFEPIVAEDGQLRAACDCQHEKTPSEKEQKIMTRTERIQALIANANCPIKEQAALEALSDAGLASLEEKVNTPAPAPGAPAPVAPAPAAPAAPVAEPVSEEPQTLEAWMKKAPPAVREMVERHAAQDAAHKSDLVNSLKAAQKTYTEAELNEMSIAQLQKIGDLLQLEVSRVAVDFSARNPLPRAANADDETVPTAWDSALNAGKDK